MSDVPQADTAKLIGSGLATGMAVVGLVMVVVLWPFFFPDTSDPLSDAVNEHISGATFDSDSGNHWITIESCGETVYFYGQVNRRGEAVIRWAGHDEGFVVNEESAVELEALICAGNG